MLVMMIRLIRVVKIKLLQRKIKGKDKTQHLTIIGHRNNSTIL